MRRTSKKGQEDEVLRDHLKKYKEAGFFINVYESKAIRVRGYYSAVNLAPGTPDLGGVCPRGYAHVNEIKAKGLRYTASEGQLKFLLNVIGRNGFGVVSDSWDYTMKVYNSWLPLDEASRRHYLLDELPKAVKTLDDYSKYDARQAEMVFRP